MKQLPSRPTDRTCPARSCDLRIEPAWATFEPATFSLHGEQASGRFTMPAYRCSDEHRYGWTTDSEYLLDLTEAVTEVDDDQLGPDGRPPIAPMFGRPRCGSCRSRLKLQERSVRAVGDVHVTIATCPDPLTFELDLPTYGCEVCGTVPSRHGAAAARTPADLFGWLFELVAQSMPLDNATLTPR